MNNIVQHVIILKRNTIKLGLPALDEF